MSPAKTALKYQPKRRHNTNFFKHTLLSTAALVVFFPFAISAQTTWPDKPVLIVVPYAPGGTTDYVARQIAQKLTEQTKHSFFVENKTGASGTIGTDGG